VAFFDAHGDLNSPQTSPSKNLHGMPLRATLGDTDSAILDLMGSALDPSQIVMVGTRDCDPPEWDYIEGHDMTVVRSAEVNDDPMAGVRALEKKGSRNVYVHVDMARRMKVTLAGNQAQKDVTDWRRARPVS